MKIMLDVSPAKLKELTVRFDFDFWQLRTPLTRNALAGVPYGLDNGCFKEFHRDRWEKQLEDAESVRPVFVCLPDVVGDAQRTVELFEYFKLPTNGLPRAIVLQDGIEHARIPWGDIEAIFIGGTDRFKVCQKTFRAAHTAKMLGKWVHVGRVNTVERLNQWIGKADSIDGSGLSMGFRDYEQLKAILKILKGEGDQQMNLLETTA